MRQGLELILAILLLAVTNVVSGAPGSRHAAAASSAPTGIAADAGTQQDISSDIEELISWVHENGGQVNVVIKTGPGLGRKMYAAKAVKAGDALLKIPLSVVYTMYPTEEGQLWWSSAINFTNELANKQSRFWPYLRTLPSREHVWSFYDLPASYLPLVQSETLEQTISDLQRAHLDGTGDYQEALRYSLSLLETRAFGAHDSEGLAMVPLLDMADHIHDCSNSYHHRKDCDGSAVNSPDGCIIFYAGRNLKQEDEVCNSYRPDTGYLSQDASLLQYGFLQDEPVSKMLSRIDRHDYNPDNPWSEPELADLQFKPVSPDQARSEIARLQQLLKDLQRRDGELRNAVKPHPRDKGGWILKQFWIWRGQRQEAIAQEISRLFEVLPQLEATAANRYSRARTVLMKGHTEL